MRCQAEAACIMLILISLLPLRIPMFLRIEYFPFIHTHLQMPFRFKCLWKSGVNGAENIFLNTGSHEPNSCPVDWRFSIAEHIIGLMFLRSQGHRLRHHLHDAVAFIPANRLRLRDLRAHPA